MVISKTSIGGTVEILAADEFTAVPILMQNSANVYKAGTPVTSAGAAALDGTNAVGILLYDVDTSKNPNAAMVVAGVIDYAKIVANASVTATASTLHTAIPAIFFRENIGVNATIKSNKSTLTVVKNATGTATITNAVGTVTVKSSDSDVATASYSSGTLTVSGVAAGDATITLTDAIGFTVSIAVTVTAS